MPTIEHIVVVMLENRSFDNVLGWTQAGFPGTNSNPNPYDANTPIPAQNLSSQTIGGSGQVYSGTMIPLLDPGELFCDMAEQILGENIGDSVPTTPPYDTYPPAPPPPPSPLMQGFTENYNSILGAGSANAENNVGDVMNYLTAEQLPVTAFLANNFAVCDQWHASVPSQTFVNRLFAFCAAPAIIIGHSPFSAVNDKDYPFHLIELVPDSNVLELPTICSQLDLVLGKKQTNWKVYFHDYSIAVLTIPYIAGKAQSESNANVSTFDGSDWGSATPGQLKAVPSTFVDDVTGVNGATLPAFSFIEPRYSRTHAPNQLPPNSNHPGPGDYGISPHTDPSDPPIDAAGGELLLMQVYNLLQSSSYWDSTLLIITYDEHGGVFDHVAPPTATPPGTVNIGTPPMTIPPAGISSGLISSKDKAAIGFGFTLYGCRVPAIIVSPLIEAGSTIAPSSGVFDHSSIVATVWENFGLSNSPSTVTSLTARDAGAPTLNAALTGSNPTGAFSGTIVACPTVVIFTALHVTGASSQVMLASAGPGVTLTVTATGTAKDDLGNEKIWLQASASAGTPGTNLTVITISVHETLILPSATYQGSITIAGTGDTASVTVPVWMYLSC